MNLSTIISPIIKKKFLITGGTSFVGKNLQEMFNSYQITYLAIGSKDYDLREWQNAKKLFNTETFDYIIHGASLQGAGNWPAEHRADCYDYNLRIHANTLKAWHLYQPQARLIGLGSSCAYPGRAIVAKEDEYWEGPLHESVDTYGLTKKNMMAGISAYKKQFGLQGTTTTFATLYGPYDDFNSTHSHVVTALVKKFVDATINNLPEVEVWGDGTQTRELIHAKDQLAGVLLALDYNGDLLNLGSGEQTSIRELADLLGDLTGFSGKVVYNTSKFVGTKNKVLDITKAKTLLGWTTEYKLRDLADGLLETIQAYKTTLKE